MKVRFFNPAKQNNKFRKELTEKFNHVLDSGDLILRGEVEEFEDALAKYVGTKYAVGLNSCTDALYLALKWAGIGPGDEVLVPSRTFVASAQVIVQLGATPVYIDLDGKFEPTKNLKAVIPVHIEGAFEPITDWYLEYAKQNDLLVIEDAAQALGATHNGKMAGSLGDAGCFSFYPAKILGALGDAGALVTDNKELYEWVKEARNHFKNTNADWGVNSRLDNLQAGFLNVKFKDLTNNLFRRQRIAEKYNSFLNGPELPPPTDGRVWQDYIIRTNKRDELFDFLKENGIETMKNNYPFPVPKLPLAQKYEDETLRLPCNDVLEDEEVDYVIEKVNAFFKK